MKGGGGGDGLYGDNLALDRTLGDARGGGRDDVQGGPGDDRFDGGPDVDECDGGGGLDSYVLTQSPGCETVVGIP